MITYPLVSFFQGFSPLCLPPLRLQSAKTKRGRREGDGKKNVTTICDKRHDNLRHGHDNLRHFMTISVSLFQNVIKRHKTSQVVIKCHDNLRQTSRQFMTFSVPSPSSRPLLDFAGSENMKNRRPSLHSVARHPQV